eukprot:CAMPEP_0194318276 /NCGR_PEP_ID=MMETSP0171-20130528/14899_1 /TAXON_ID=218684 /ORGANISM="Corethron pennatum, Strain L29A3" /LENGTH=271 /DNA_ID=CAMNT_0039075133 /DNA_START=326 /DNA_END=1144 /DNA_ORIENTATION=+
MKVVVARKFPHTVAVFHCPQAYGARDLPILIVVALVSYRDGEAATEVGDRGPVPSALAPSSFVPFFFMEAALNLRVRRISGTAGVAPLALWTARACRSMKDLIRARISISRLTTAQRCGYFVCGSTSPEDNRGRTSRFVLPPGREERAVPQDKNRPRVPHESEPDAHPKAFRGIIVERYPGPSGAGVRVCIEAVVVRRTWTFTRDQEVVRYIGSMRGKGIICIIISVLAVVDDFEGVVRVPAKVDVWGGGETTGWGVGGNIGWKDEKEHDH